MNEIAIKFGPDKRMAGIASVPTRRVGPAFVFPNAGAIHRVGPNRLHVKLSRAIAGLGHLAFRFDCQGLGDSAPGPAGEGSYVGDTYEAMNLLAKEFGYREFAIVGLCTGAVAAFRCARVDTRITAIALLNPIGLELEPELQALVGPEAQWRYYSVRALRSQRSWSRFFRGESNYRGLAKSVVGALRRGADATKPVENAYLSRLRSELLSILERGTRLLLVHSEWGAESELLSVLNLGAALQRSLPLSVQVIKDSDHTFTPLRCQQQLVAVVEQWARECAPLERVNLEK